jgi:putative transposase
MITRRKIHTHLKVLVSLNALPIEYKNKVHASQIRRYANTNAANYFGYDLGDTLNTEIQFVKQLGDYTTAILKIFVFFRVVCSGGKAFKSNLRKQKKYFVELMQRYKDIIPIPKFGKLIGLKESTLRQWIRQERVSCTDSLINICRRVNPNQLLISETNKLKKLIMEDEFKFWPLCSVYYFALRNNIVSMCLSTWYKYAALLNIKRLKPKTVKTKKPGIRASKPNEIWHADVTYFFTPDRVKLYIYTVIDNFSRFPLCIKVSEKLSGAIRVDAFREALKTALTLNPSIENLMLMTDGGSENFNGNVTEFLNSIDTFDIKHIKALSNGWPSNSMVEAFHYVLKIYYLNHMDIRSENGLTKAVGFVNCDFAYKRPHTALIGLTPFEVYCGKNPQEISFATQLKSTRIARIIQNQSHNCIKNCKKK